MKIENCRIMNLKIIFIFMIIVFGVFVFAKNSLAAVIFENGWERASGVGCTAPSGVVDLHVTDRLDSETPGSYRTDNWDYNHSPDPYSACGLINGYPCVATVTSPVHSGLHSFRFHCPKNFPSENGRWGSIDKTFSSTYGELYIRYYIRWDSNFRFVGADYKSTGVAMAGTGFHTYNSYYGDGGDGTTGRLKFFWTGGYGYPVLSTNITLTLDTWHLVEWHLVHGASAATTYMQARFNGTLVNWEKEDESSVGTTFYCPSVEYSDTGNFEGFNINNTINGYYSGIGSPFPNAIPADTFIYYDDVEINNRDG